MSLLFIFTFTDVCIFKVSFFVVLLWVEWDNGNVNKYTYSEQLNAYTIQKVNEQRIRTGEMIAVGCRVVRGNYHSIYNKKGYYSIGNGMIPINYKKINLRLCTM